MAALFFTLQFFVIHFLLFILISLFQLVVISLLSLHHLNFSFKSSLYITFFFFLPLFFSFFTYTLLFSPLSKSNSGKDSIYYFNNPCINFLKMFSIIYCYTHILSRSIDYISISITSLSLYIYSYVGLSLMVTDNIPSDYNSKCFVQ